MLRSSTYSAIARQLAFSLIRHGGRPALDAEPLARGQVFALPAVDLKKLLVDQIVTISELTRRRSIAQVRVLIVHHGDSLIQKLVLIALDVSYRTAGALEATVSRRPVHCPLGC
jgi:hypothetical protein